ncbi:MAG: hypothetical protein CMN13_12575 [Roseobacter sp.]|nr:hypothetical protein [Roseobacter sp.]|tara:strand:+ start:464 stop:721 length:258 start_codon:yes stop_codon:yes gene_type:complete
MSKSQKRIEALTKEIEQKKALLSDLAQKAKEEDRRKETRKKILYGGAFLAYLAALPPEKKRLATAAIEARITNRKDRQFLGLPEL